MLTYKYIRIELKLLINVENLKKNYYELITVHLFFSSNLYENKVFFVFQLRLVLKDI